MWCKLRLRPLQQRTIADVRAWLQATFGAAATVHDLVVPNANSRRPLALCNATNHLASPDALVDSVVATIGSSSNALGVAATFAVRTVGAFSRPTLRGTAVLPMAIDAANAVRDQIERSLCNALEAFPALCRVTSLRAGSTVATFELDDDRPAAVVNEALTLQLAASNEFDIAAGPVENAQSAQRTPTPAPSVASQEPSTGAGTTPSLVVGVAAGAALVVVTTAAALVFLARRRSRVEATADGASAMDDIDPRARDVVEVASAEGDFGATPTPNPLACVPEHPAEDDSDVPNGAVDF